MITSFLKVGMGQRHILLFVLYPISIMKVSEESLFTSVQKALLCYADKPSLLEECGSLLCNRKR